MSDFDSELLVFIYDTRLLFVVVTFHDVAWVPYPHQTMYMFTRKFHVKSSFN